MKTQRKHHFSVEDLNYGHICPLFRCHLNNGLDGRNDLSSVLLFSLEKNYCACIVTSQLHGFVEGLSKKKNEHTTCKCELTVKRIMQKN